MDDEEFGRRVADGEFIEHAGYASHRYGTLRSEVDPRLAEGRSVVLEIELQGARQIRETDAGRGAGVHRPALARGSAPRASRAAAPTARSRSRSRLAVAAEELGARDEFGHVIENDDVERAVAGAGRARAVAAGSRRR